MWLIVFQRLVFDFLIHLLYFPIWWYTGGAKRALLFCAGLVRDGNYNLSPGLWLKNVLVPMFGQTDWQGRLMSIFMRIVNVIVRSFGLLVWTTIMVGVFFIWLLFPVFVTTLLLRSF